MIFRVVLHNQEGHMQLKYSYIDLSIPIEFSKSEPEPVEIERIDHQAGAEILTQNSQVQPQDFPSAMAVNLERIKMTSHSGTHVDAPFHYGPTCEGKRAKTIDELPLDWFDGPSLVLDCRLGKGNSITLEEIQEALQRQNLSISKYDIVLINTGADALWGTQEYFTHFRGIDVSVCEWLTTKGVRVIGVDTFGFDLPFHKMINLFEKTKNSDVLWPCHMFGRKKEYCQIERLFNLASLPKHQKFILSCFPIKLSGCGGAPARVVAKIKE